MNDTIVNTSSHIQDSGTNLHGYNYAAYILGTLLLISEVLPLIKSRSNGISHSLLCLISGSKCVLDKVENAILDIDDKIQEIP